MSLSEREQGNTSVSVFLFHGSPVRGRVPTGILMTRSSSSVKAGSLDGKRQDLRGALETSLSLKAGEIHSFQGGW